MKQEKPVGVMEIDSRRDSDGAFAEAAGVDRDGPSTALVRQGLARILASPDFDATARNRRFLEFVVLETLAGRAGRIKAYSIATTVFGRDPGFDPQADPIVRIEAGRLRRSIERYYLRGGQRDRLRIAVPRGSYVPSFTLARPAQVAEGNDPRLSARSNVSVMVAPFDADADVAGLDQFGRGFARHVTIALTRVGSLVVFNPPTAEEELAGEGAAEVARPGCAYVVCGGMALAKGALVIDVLLREVATGRCLWGDTFTCRARPAEMVAIRDRVAEAVVQALGQPYGALFDEKLRELEAREPAFLTSYEHVLRFYRYWRRLDRTEYSEVRDGLEQAFATDPDHPEVVACLSLLCTDAVRYKLRPRGGQVDTGEVARAVDLANRAIALAPRASIGFHALGLAFWFAGRAEQAFEAFEQGLRLNPNDADLLAEAGLRRTFQGDWAKGVKALKASYAINPNQPSTYRIGLALWHYAEGRHAEALEEVARVDSPNAIHVAVLRAAAAAERGDAALARAAVAAIRAIDAGYAERAAADLAARGLSAGLVRRVVSSLQRAGLGVPAETAVLR